MANTQRIGSHKTTVQIALDGLRVVYHSTAVVERTPEGIKLDSGGWKTATTKTRMNQASNQFGLGFRVYSCKHGWFVDFNGKTLTFEDGMVLRG